MGVLERLGVDRAPDLRHVRHQTWDARFGRTPNLGMRVQQQPLKRCSRTCGTNDERESEILDFENRCH
jgi:hypothetical protein